MKKAIVQESGIHHYTCECGKCFEAWIALGNTCDQVTSLSLSLDIPPKMGRGRRFYPEPFTKHFKKIAKKIVNTACRVVDVSGQC